MCFYCCCCCCSCFCRIACVDVCYRRYFLLFEFPAREMMKDCVSELIPAHWPRLGPATSGTRLITTPLLRRKTFPQRHESVGIRQSWNFWPEYRVGGSFDYCWPWNVPFTEKWNEMNLHEINHLVESKVGKHFTKDALAFSILYAPADFSFYVHMEKAKGAKARRRFQVKIPGISFLSGVSFVAPVQTCFQWLSATYVYKDKRRTQIQPGLLFKLG